VVKLLERVRRRWCRLAHGRPMWPVMGRYLCPVCLASYPVLWQGGPVRKSEMGDSAVKQSTQKGPEARDQAAAAMARMRS
jgi:hypothetical protein